MEHLRHFSVVALDSYSARTMQSNDFGSKQVLEMTNNAFNLVVLKGAELILQQTDSDPLSQDVIHTILNAAVQQLTFL